MKSSFRNTVFENTQNNGRLKNSRFRYTPSSEDVDLAPVHKFKFFFEQNICYSFTASVFQKSYNSTATNNLKILQLQVSFQTQK
jgi:hypothetical protein